MQPQTQGNNNRNPSNKNQNTLHKDAHTFLYTPLLRFTLLLSLFLINTLLFAVGTTLYTHFEVTFRGYHGYPRYGLQIMLQNGGDLMRQMHAARGRSFLSAFTLRVMPLSDTLEQKRPARRVMPLVLVEYSGLLHASTAAICVE